MQLINRYRATVVLIAVFALVGAGMFAIEAYAGPNCGARSAATKSACTKTTTATVQKASAESRSWTKEECMAKMMAAGMTKADAEAKYAQCSKSYNAKTTASLASAKSGCSKTTASLASAKSGCSKSARATTASASGKACCASKTTASLASAKSGCSSKTTASLASSKSGCNYKTTASLASSKSGCSSKKSATVTASLASAQSQTCDREACVAKLMKEKNMTRVEAEALWANCQKGLAAGKTCHGDSKATATATVASAEKSAPSITTTVSGGTR